MALPKLNTIEYFAKLPVSGLEAKYRPFTVGEQKVLLQALEAEEVKTIANTVINLVESCCSLEDSKDTIRGLSNTDLEYLFLQIRIKSVGEKTQVYLGCEKQPDCDGQTAVEVDISDIDVVGEITDNKVMLTDTVGIGLKVPSFQEVQSIIENRMEVQTQDVFDILGRCIENIFDHEEVHQRSDFSDKELQDFIDELSVEQFNLVMKWFEDLPKLTKEVNYNCVKCNHNQTIRLEGIQNFFV